MKFFITGINRGIGLEFVRRLLQRGDQVIGTVRDGSDVSRLESLRRDFPKTLFAETVDLASDESVAAWIKQSKVLSEIDVVISNAGFFAEDDKGFGRVSMDAMYKSFGVNTFGPVRLLKAMTPLLESHPPAKVIHLTSLMGSVADNQSGSYYAYRMSKAALNMFNKSFSIDFPQIVSVVIHPGWVKTDMGGPNATLSVEQSVAGMIKVMDGLTLKDSGKFLDWEGRQLPW